MTHPSVPVVVTALVDLAARGDGGGRPRSLEQYLDQAPAVLSVQLPMVVFTEPALVAELAEMRSRLAPKIPTVVSPYVPHDEWPDDVDALALWLTEERPLCSSNEAKDTPRYLAFGWSKPWCLRRAAALLEAPWYWWIDIGVAHSSSVPADLADRLAVASARRVGQRSEPGRVIHLVALDRDGWHASPANRDAVHRGAATNDRDWWFGGAQLVAGGVIGVAGSALEQIGALVRDAVVDAAAHRAAVTDEMLLTRMIVQNDEIVETSSGSYDDLFSRLPLRPRIDNLCPSTRFTALPGPARSDRSAFNPSIANDPAGGFRLVVRHGNYRYVDGRYVDLDGSGLIVTENVMMSLGSDLAIRWVAPIDDTAARVRPALFPVHGLEDMRLFHHDGDWWASATSREHRPDGLCEIVVSRFADDRDPARVTSAVRLTAPKGDRHEKNWAPVVGDATDLPSRMRFLWSTDPAGVVAVDRALGALCIERPLPPDLHRCPVRGGSQVVAVDDGWLTVVHRVVVDHRRRVYEHRLIDHDRDFSVRARSPWFVFMTEGIEFCAGLATTDEGVVMSFGVDDRQAWLAVVAWHELRSVLRPEGQDDDVIIDGIGDDGRRHGER